MPLLVAYSHRKPAELLWRLARTYSTSARDYSCTDVIKQDLTMRKPLDFYNIANHHRQKRGEDFCIGFWLYHICRHHGQHHRTVGEGKAAFPTELVLLQTRRPRAESNLSTRI